MIDNHMMCLEHWDPCSCAPGLFFLNNSLTSIFYSATTSQFHEFFLTKHFNVDQDHMYTFKSSSEINDGVKSNCANIEKSLTKTDAETIKMVE
jgi:hypothetical protein